MSFMEGLTLSISSRLLGLIISTLGRKCMETMDFAISRLVQNEWQLYKQGFQHTQWALAYIRIITYTTMYICMYYFRGPDIFISTIIKFIYSEKATKFCEIFTLLLSYVMPVKSKVKISQNCVPFSEFMNFNSVVGNHSDTYTLGKFLEEMSRSCCALEPKECM